MTLPTVSDAERIAPRSGRWAPSIKSFHIERAAYDFLITLVFDKLFERRQLVRRVGVRFTQLVSGGLQLVQGERGRRCSANGQVGCSERRAAERRVDAADEQPIVRRVGDPLRSG